MTQKCRNCRYWSGVVGSHPTKVAKCQHRLVKQMTPEFHYCRYYKPCPGLESMTK
jgi:hypothetical protein